MEAHYLQKKDLERGRRSEACIVSLLSVQAEADSGLGSPSTTGSLLGRRLGDETGKYRLNSQARVVNGVRRRWDGAVRIRDQLVVIIKCDNKTETTRLMVTSGNRNDENKERGEGGRKWEEREEREGEGSRSENF